MTHKLKGILVTAAAIAALAVGGGAIAAATGGDHGQKRGDQGEKRDKRITGGALGKASKVALAHTGGGRVTDTEIRDEEGYYEIEVVRNDGSQVDVHLDRNFNVLDASPDGAGDKHGPNDH